MHHASRDSRRFIAFAPRLDRRTTGGHTGCGLRRDGDADLAAAADADEFVTRDADSIVGRIGGDSPVRYITSDDHRKWTVREIASNQYDRRDAHDLVFISHDVVRRVRDYPRDWHMLDDAALYALSLGPYRRRADDSPHL